MTLGWSEPVLVERALPADRGGRHPVVERFIDAPFVPNDLALHEHAPAARDHRSEHGGQVDLHAPGRADRRAGPHRQLRARHRGADRAGRPDLHAHRRRRRSRRRALDVHGRDDRDRQHPAQRDRAQPGPDGRDRPRHQHLRRLVAGLRDRLAHRDPGARVHAVRDALFRAHGAGARGRLLAPTCTWTRPSTKTRWCSCTPCAMALPTAASACRSPRSPAYPARSSRRRGSTCSSSRAQSTATRPASLPLALPLPLELPPASAEDERARALLARLGSLDIDALTPRAALDLLYALRQLAEGATPP